MRYTVRCSTCNQELTQQLEKLELLPEVSDEQALVPVGFFAIEQGDFVINLLDALNTRHHPDPERLDGCCGLSGTSGRNVVCANGHEVGSEHSDCCMPHSLNFDKNVTWLDRIWV